MSVQVCTLNEEKNIGPCIDAILANDPQDVLVIDGGSSDCTVDVARGKGVRVIEAGRIGLAAQRRLGFLTSTSPYTAFVDADDRLEEGWLATMLTEAEAGGYAALQSLLRVKDQHSWWAAAWNEYFSAAITPSADTIIVGRPALIRTEALLRLPAPSNMVVEDTEMSRQFVLLGLRMGIGTAVSYRLCPTSRSENWEKWRGYGRGYRQFVHKYPSRRKAIAKHMLFTVPVTRSLPAVRRGKVSQALFGAMMSGNFIAGWLQGNPDES